MKRLIIITMLLVTTLVSRAFSFSQATNAGQMLYYTIYGNSVTVVAPNGSDWSGYSKPTGRLVIPASVVYNNTTYAVTTIGEMSFQECTGLTSVTIPESVTTIGTRAFANAENMRSVFMSEGVENINMMAFSSCTSLDTIVLPESLKRIAKDAFTNSGYFNNTANWNADKALIICHWIISVGNTVDTPVTIADTIVGIANNAFFWCRYMPKVTIPASVQYIGEMAFSRCLVLDTVRMLSSNPPALPDNAFADMPTPTLAVPCGSVDAYQSAENWNSLNIYEDPCDEPPVNPNAIDDCSIQSIEWHPTDNGVVVMNAEGSRLIVVDAMGRTVARINHATSCQHIVLPTVGLYLLTANDAAVKICYLK